MADIVLGMLAILAGLVFCFGGRIVLRIALPIWGFFAGFAFGAGLVAGFSDDHFLGTVLGWVLGFVFALLFALLAYLFYALAVIIAMGSAGFALGSGIVVALGIDWNWVAVLIGIALGVVLGILAIVIDAPLLVLILFSSVTGAIGVTAGLMLLTGSLDSADFTKAGFSDRIDDSWGWYLTVVVIAVVSIFVQTRNAAAIRRGMRADWVAMSSSSSSS